MNDGTTIRPAPRTVIGLFDDLADARRAIESLQLHGFDGGELAIAGSRAEAADADAERDRPDQRVVGYVGGRIVRGGAIGLAAGLLVGAVAAAILVALGGGTGAAVGSVVMGTFLGATLGVLWNAYRTVGTNADAWQATFHEAGGHGAFGVTVACRREGDVDRATSVMAAAGGGR